MNDNSLRDYAASLLTSRESGSRDSRCAPDTDEFWKDAARHRTMKQAVSSGSWEFCRDTGYFTIDHAMGQFHGISPDIQTCTPDQLFRRVDEDEILQIKDAIQESQDPFIHLHYRIEDPAGGYVYLMSCGFLTGTTVIGCTVDISDMVIAKKQVEKDNQRLEVLLDITRQVFLNEEEMLKYALKKLTSLIQCEYGYICLFGSSTEDIIRDVFFIDGRMGSLLIRKGSREDLRWIQMLAQMQEPLVVNRGSPHAALKMLYAYRNLELTSLLSVTVSDEDTSEVRILAALGNSMNGFTQGDVRELQLVMQYIWQLMLRRRKEQRHREVHEQLLHTQRLETTGRLVGSVAHDFKNMLTVILGNLDLLEYSWREGGEPSGDDCFKEALQDIRGAADRAVGISRQLLLYSKKHKHTVEKIHLADHVRSITGMLERLVDEDITVQAIIPRDVWIVEGDIYQLYQVLLNLFVNARDALDKGGSITLEVRNRWIRSTHEGRYVEIAVHDTGAGIEKEQLHQIFDPFYTTKQQQGGSGIGLATVRDIVEAHHGRIEVESIPGRGSSFYIRLPAVEQTACAEHQAVFEPDIPEELPYCRVLVVERNRMVRSQLCRILVHLGCDVVTAEHALTASRLLESETDWCDLMIAPGAVIQEIRKESVPSLALGGPAGEYVLEKPFRMGDCARQIRKVLEERTKENSSDG